MRMKVLVIGSGGREHTIIWKLKNSKKVEKIYCAPGNGGISTIAECIPIDVMDVENIIKFSKENKIDLVIVAPENPLSIGMVDELEKNNIRAFGPSKKAAVIEGSKAFSKELMKKHNIPTAEYEIFESSESAVKYLDNVNFPIVIKADGLSLGKGVIIAENYEKAKQAIRDIMEEKEFGEAGNKVVIEEFLEGTEVSILAFTDGKTVIPMTSSQDHKRVFDDDKGLNTGGMGAFAPSRIYNQEFEKYCMENIYIKTINAMQSEGRTFKGVLYFGLIITKSGPKVIEYNCRFGDPETQVVLPLLKTDLLDIFNAIIDEKLDKIDIEWDKKAAVCIVLASGGYPQKYEKGILIDGLAELEGLEDLIVFHAGTKIENGEFYTNGGRVLGITAVGTSIEEARSISYNAIEKINFKGMHFRKDIGIVKRA